MEPLLRFENVSKHYPNGVHALKGVSFEMAEGEFISVIGPSGSGKSTLLRAINRLIPISGGTVWLDGQAVSAQRGAALRQLRRKLSHHGTPAQGRGRLRRLRQGARYPQGRRARNR